MWAAAGQITHNVEPEHLDAHVFLTNGRLFTRVELLSAV
jgi:hypothetical protein